MRFTEVKTRLSGERLEYTCQLLEQEAGRLVLRYDLAHGDAIEGVELPAGSVCYGYFWEEHPYNVYHWMSPAGETIAFYVNLSGPTVIGEDFVEWSDLVVDVLLVPDPTLGYQVQILDEREIPLDLDEATHNHIYDALEEVMGGWPAMVRTLAAHSARLRERLN